MFTVRELFNFKLLAIPDLESYRIPQDAIGLGKSPLKNEGGVYIFYSLHGEALYIGISGNIRNRIKDHLLSGKGNSDLGRYYAVGNDLELVVFYESNKVYQEVYESYLIHQLKPRFNIDKTGRHRINECK